MQVHWFFLTVAKACGEAEKEVKRRPKNMCVYLWLVWEVKQGSERMSPLPMSENRVMESNELYD